MRVEVGAPPAHADRLDHFDRGDRVELLGDLAIILQPDLDPVGEARLGDLGVGPCLLLLGQRQADDADAAPRRLDRQAPPAAADVEQPLPGLQIQPVEQQASLRRWASSRRLVREGKRADE